MSVGKKEIPQLKNIMENAIRISFILPVYNVEKYLDDCLLSIVGQDIEDYEIICVNDGSKDDSLSKLREWERKYPTKITVIDKPNGGLSSARNAGLDIAKGEFVWFIDSDDYIAENCCGFLLKIAADNQLDILEFNYAEVLEDSQFKDAPLLEANSSGLPLLNGPPTNLRMCNSVCMKIFKRELFEKHQLRFQTAVKIMEDVAFTYELSFFKFRKMFLDRQLYCYRQRPGSILSTKGRLAAEKHLESMLAMIDIYEQSFLQRTSSMDDKTRMAYLRNKNERIVMLTQYALLDAVRIYSSDELNVLLANLKEKGLYPYQLNWSLFKGLKESRKQQVINYFLFLFPFESYLKMCRIFFGLKKSNRTGSVPN